MIFTASLHPSQTWLLRQLSFSSQRVTGKHILQDPLVTVSGYDWGTSTLKCLLSIAKAAPPVPATRGAESTYIPDPLSHPSLLLLLHLLLPPGAQQQPAGQQEPPFSEPRTPAATKPCADSWQAPQVQVSLAARRGLKGELQGSWKGDLPSCHPVHEAVVLLFFCPALSCTHIKARTPHWMQRKAVPLPSTPQPASHAAASASCPLPTPLPPSPCLQISLGAHVWLSCSPPRPPPWCNPTIPLPLSCSRGTSLSPDIAKPPPARVSR